MTLHSFARHLLEKLTKKAVKISPRLSEVVMEDAQILLTPSARLTVRWRRWRWRFVRCGQAQCNKDAVECYCTLLHPKIDVKSSINNSTQVADDAPLGSSCGGWI